MIAVILHEPIFFSLWNFLQRYFPLDDNSQSICLRSLMKGKELCRPSCQYGYFSLYGMQYCHAWLTCDTIQGVQRRQRIGGGLVKEVFLARWGDFDVAYSQLTTPQYREDFQQGLKILQRFHGSQRITQLIGFCDDILMTEYYTLGKSASFENHGRAFPEINDISLRLQLCVDYVEILSVLHSSIDGVRYVMCDTNRLDKLLTQYLLSDDVRLVLNDVDSVAEMTLVGGEWRGIKCGKLELEGEFVAPEQKWTGAMDFNDTEMQTYDEKTDIWKVPDVCNFFLGSGPEATRLQLKLLDIHMACKNLNPRDRPTAVQLMWTYRKLLAQIKE